MPHYLTFFSTFEEASWWDKIKIIFIGIVLPFHVFWLWAKGEL